MNTIKEELSEQVKLFLKRNDFKEAHIIIDIMMLIKQKSGMTLEDAIQTINELLGYTPQTIKEIIFQVRFKHELIAGKHVNYFKAICRNVALGPKMNYVSSMLKVNY
jgi:NADH:ubiquinone oxidoreductase subunit E